MTPDKVLTDAHPEYVRPVGLRSLGCNSHFAKPYTIRSPHRVSIGRDVWFGPRTFLSVVEEHEGTQYTPTLRIGDRCVIESDLLVHCAGEIDIGSDVAITKRIFIGDSFRDYSDPETLPVEWSISEPEPVKIGDGVYLGTGAIICPGVTIGARTVVSAGAVVVRSVPPRSVVFGNPARVTMSWDEATGGWVSGIGRQS